MMEEHDCPQCERARSVRWVHDEDDNGCRRYLSCRYCTYWDRDSVEADDCDDDE